MSNIKLELGLRISSHMHESNFTTYLIPGRLEFEKSDSLISKLGSNSHRTSPIV